MDIIVRGELHELDFVRRICRDKVRRGVIAILPATSPAYNEVACLKKELDEIHSENEILKEQIKAMNDDSQSVRSECLAPETIDLRLPEISNVSESVSVDDKYVDDGDIEEVDIDAEDKAITDVDSKDVTVEDRKDIVNVRKAPRRSHKSE